MIADVKGGKLLADLSKYEGKRVEITLYKPTRSNNQNRYYWSVVIPHVVEVIRYLFGEKVSPEDAHEICKSKFLPKKLVLDRSTGEEITISGSTTTRNVEEMTNYIDSIRSWAWHYGQVVIPNAD